MLERLLVEQRLRVGRAQQRELPPGQLDPLLDQIHERQHARGLRSAAAGKGGLVAKETIAVLGTGTMGAPIARHLLKAGFDVRAWNRTRERAEPLAERRRERRTTRRPRRSTAPASC